MSVSREAPNANSIRMQRATRQNMLDAVRLRHNLVIMDHEQTRENKLLNQDIRKIKATLEFINRSSGWSAEGRPPQWVDRGQREELEPLYMYGDRTRSRNFGKKRRVMSAFAIKRDLQDHRSSSRPQSPYEDFPCNDREPVSQVAREVAKSARPKSSPVKATRLYTSEEARELLESEQANAQVCDGDDVGFITEGAAALSIGEVDASGNAQGDLDTEASRNENLMTKIVEELDYEDDHENNRVGSQSEFLRRQAPGPERKLRDKISGDGSRNDHGAPLAAKPPLARAQRPNTAAASTLHKARGYTRTSDGPMAGRRPASSSTNQRTGFNRPSSSSLSNHRQDGQRPGSSLSNQRTDTPLSRRRGSRSSTGQSPEVFLTKFKNEAMQGEILRKKKAIDMMRQDDVNSRIVSFLEDYPLPTYIIAEQKYAQVGAS